MRDLHDVLKQKLYVTLDEMLVFEIAVHKVLLSTIDQ